MKLQYATVCTSFISISPRKAQWLCRRSKSHITQRTGWSTYLAPVDLLCVSKFPWANTKAVIGEAALKESSRSLQNNNDNKRANADFSINNCTLQASMSFHSLYFSFMRLQVMRLTNLLISEARFNRFQKGEREKKQGCQSIICLFSALYWLY